MIRWKHIVSVFALGAAVGAAISRRARPQPAAEVVPPPASQEQAPPTLPPHDDPRWHQVPCPDDDVNCQTLWLRLGDALVGIDPQGIGLMLGERNIGGMPGARRYVEAVHYVWRARRAALN